jgi:very-short-patch-repair endonuclease
MSQLEDKFSNLWRMLGDGTIAVPEYRFHFTRRWRADFAFVDEKVLVELEGGIFSKGRHTRGMGFHKDCDKYNEAVRHGFVVLRFTILHVDNDPAGMVNTITDVLKRRRHNE